MDTKKTESKESKSQGNIYDTFVKRMFSQIFVFIDFLVHYADQNFSPQFGNYELLIFVTRIP